MGDLDKVSVDDRFLYHFIKAKGACTSTEMAAKVQGLPSNTPTASLPKSMDRKPARKAMGRLMAEDLIRPVTMYASRGVFWIPTSAPTRGLNVFALRRDAQKKNPNLFPSGVSPGGGRTAEWWINHVLDGLTSEWQTTKDLASSIDMRAETVARYLKKLDSLGYVNTKKLNTGKRGRPSTLWRLDPDPPEGRPTADRSITGRGNRRLHGETQSPDDSVLIVDFSKMPHADKVKYGDV